MSLSEQDPESRSVVPGHRVLIVDDDAALREQLSAYLPRQGIDCSFVADSTEALSALAAQRPAVVLLDVQLPDMSGLALAAQIAAMRPRPRIVLMSGYDDAVCAAKQSNIEVFAVIEKPVPLRTVARTLQQALQRSP